MPQNRGTQAQFRFWPHSAFIWISEGSVGLGWHIPPVQEKLFLQQQQKQFLQKRWSKWCWIAVSFNNRWTCNIFFMLRKSLFSIYFILSSAGVVLQRRSLGHRPWPSSLLTFCHPFVKPFFASKANMNVQRINGYDDFRTAQPNLIKCPNSIAS